MTTRTLTLAAALGAATLLGLGLPAAAQQAEVRIGTIPESYPPFTQVEANGELKGFEIDVGNALCAEMKVTCRWVLQAWDGIIPALQESKFDAIIASMSITDERKQVIDFSDKYYDTPAMFIGRKDEKVEITPAGMKGKTVGVQVSTIHANYVQAKFGDVVDIRTYDTQENANLDLIAGRVDLIMADSIALQDGFLNTPDGADFEVKGQPFTDPLLGAGVGVGVRKADTALRDKFSAAIKAVRADGTYKAINDKYFKFDAYGG
jgi:lysine-arginine-ornithine-binding protein